MSSAKPPQGKEPVTLQSTRQMLDELDALMDRMLALPVNDVDDSAPPPPDIVRMPTVSATLTVMEPAEEEKVEEEAAPKREKAPLLQESFPSYTTDFASESTNSDSFLFRPKPKEIPPEPEPISEDLIPPSITKLPVPVSKPKAVSKPKPLAKPKRRPKRPLGARILLPLLWFNQTFDLATMLLGGPGRWLRGPGGRRVLGWTGLALVAATGLWLAKDLLGWTW